MNRDPILHAMELVGAAAEILQQEAAVERPGEERSEIRYAEALARTLLDHLSAMDHSLKAMDHVAA
jgi:hypothetical protein